MKKVLLCILDGVGISENKDNNAFYNANTKNIDSMINKYGMNLIEASGEYVGLPKNQMGNSEVGHLNIGAGRIFYQPLARINHSIETKNFYSNTKLLNTIRNSKGKNKKLHIIGMISDGGVHSHIDHIKALLKMCFEEKVDNLYFHLITDGRDTYEKSATKYIDELQEEIDKYKLGSISTICGRYYGMDRDKRWDRIKKAYDSIVNNRGEKYNSYKELIESNYKKDIYDEFIVPGIIDEKGMIEDGDSVIWANFRPDRAWEILYALSNPMFNEFETTIKDINVTTLMSVSDLVKCTVAFEDEKLENTLGVYLSKMNLKQLRIAETEKYAHVTYFFDGLVDKELDGCKRILIPSPKVATYDLKPEMSAKEITKTLLDEMNNDYDFILLNYANCDMVGHTGDYGATIKAVETVDEMIGKIYEKCKELNYTLIITADHGNCEEMKNEDGVVTKHTTNKVPFIVCENHAEIKMEKLSDIAPFILKYMNLQIPDEMK